MCSGRGSFESQKLVVAASAAAARDVIDQRTGFLLCHYNCWLVKQESFVLPALAILWCL
jgi:hypothetical protein